ncbi:MAG: hypothetical protein QME83_17370, partial [Thermodesulfobacteriota bacterium]|nr:hypothetical protein [Thermodesulfobacteriota bacterium]
GKNILSHLCIKLALMPVKGVGESASFLILFLYSSLKCLRLEVSGLRLKTSFSSILQPHTFITV